MPSRARASGTSVSCALSFQLALHALANVLDSLADLALGGAVRLLRVTRGFVSGAFVLQLGIVGELSRTLLGLAFQLIDFAFDFIAVHVIPPRYTVPVTCYRRGVRRTG